jgi:outer membrane biosynthesis protein TonB
MLHNSELHGTVTVEVCIDQRGEVAAVRAVKGHPLAVSSTIESVRNWSFAPYKRNGEARPAIGRMKVKYDFRAQAHGGNAGTSMTSKSQ